MNHETSFPISTATIIVRQLDRHYADSLVIEKAPKYFWCPPRFKRDVVLRRVDAWRMPIWRIRGSQSARWTRIRQEIVTHGEGEDARQETIDVSEPASESFAIDWIVLAREGSSAFTNVLLSAIEVLNTDQRAVRVRWNDFGAGEWVESRWPRFENRFRAKRGKSGNRSKVANGWRLFESSIKRLPPQSRSQEAILQAHRSLEGAVGHMRLEIEPIIKRAAKSSSSRAHGVVLEPPDIKLTEPYWFPIWHLEYEAEGSIYTGIVNGFNGVPLLLELPTSLGHGILAWFITMSLIGLWIILFLGIISIAVSLFLAALRTNPIDLKILGFLPLACLLPFIIGLPWLVRWVYRRS